MKILPIKPLISFSDFDKLDIRVGEIKTVTDIVESDKMVEFLVDFGDHTRTILVGMKKEREIIKEVEGKQALFVVNLPEKEMFGRKSQGMLFDIGYSNGITPVLATTEKLVPNGVSAG